MTSSVQDWARAYLLADDLEAKCRPTPPPAHWAHGAASMNVKATRPSNLKVTLDQPEPFKLTALKNEETRCRLMHKFWHHELQAAELMAWALLRFSETPHAFRSGLLRILLDEVRHMGMYEDYLRRRGRTPGDYPVRDFLWQRVETCETPLSFVALFGMGMEAANIEHAARFHDKLLAAGDEEGAQIQKQIGAEEVPHVRFAVDWFRTWTSGMEFADYRAALPPDLPPSAVRGRRLELEPRRRTGMPDEFLKLLAAWGRD